MHGGNDKGGVGGGKEEAKKATFYWCQQQKTIEINPACLSGLPEFDLGGFFLDSAESVSVFV